MLFIPLAEIDRRAHNTSADYCKQVPFGFRLLFTVSIVCMVLQQVWVPGLALANIPTRTFARFELWRIVSPPLGCLEGAVGGAGVLVAFWWLLSLFPHYERKYSTVHLLIEVLCQNVSVQVLYSIVVSILVQEGWIMETYNNFAYSLGWFPLVIIWAFKYSAECPNEKSSFCFLPCPVQNRLLGWILGLFFVLMSAQKLVLVLATLLGALQYQFLGRPFLQPSFCIHRSVECLFPKCIKQWESFITLSQVENDLKLYIGSRELQQLHSQQQQQQQQHQLQNVNQSEKQYNCQELEYKSGSNQNMQ